MRRQVGVQLGQSVPKIDECRMVFVAVVGVCVQSFGWETVNPFQIDIVEIDEPDVKTMQPFTEVAQERESVHRLWASRPDKKRVARQFDDEVSGQVVAPRVDPLVLQAQEGLRIETLGPVNFVPDDRQPPTLVQLIHHVFEEATAPMSNGKMTSHRRM